MNRFVTKVTDKCLPFFCTLKKSFEWTNECQKAFENLKVYLSSLPLLSPSRPGEELYLYLVVSQVAISTALVERKIDLKDPSTLQVEHSEKQKKGTPRWRSWPSHW